MADRPVLGVALGAACIAFSAVLVRLSDVPPLTSALYRCAYAVPVLGVLAALERRRSGPRPRRMRLLAVVAGALFAADLILWHYAIEAVGAGLATVLGNLQVVVVALIAWAVLGERPDRRLFAALPVVLVGVVGVSGVVGGSAYGRDPVLGAVLGGLTSLAYGAFILVLRSGGATGGPVRPLFDATAVSAVVTVVVAVVAGNAELAPAWPQHGWLVLLALTSQVAGWLFISVSLPKIPAAVTSMLLLLQPVGAMTVAAVVLDERPSLLQLAGSALILCGVVLATRKAQQPDDIRNAPEAAGASAG